MQSEAEDPHATLGSRKNWTENVHRRPILGGKCIQHRVGVSGELLGIFGGVVPLGSQNPDPPGSQNPDPQQKTAIFHTRYQTRGLILESPGNLKTFALGPSLFN